MTTGSTSNNHHALHPRDDRETLSALFDGELAPDAMRFALRRLDHDAGWRDSCGRWQLIGDALRGEAVVVAPPDFASSVMQALAAESPTAQWVAPDSGVLVSSSQAIARRRWLGGAALAASVAMAAVLVMRPVPEPSAPSTGPQVAAGIAPPAATTQPTASSRGAELAAPSNPSAAVGAAAVPATAVAAAETSPPAASRPASRVTHASARTAHAVPAPAAGEPATVVATAAPVAGHQPFHPPADAIVTRPWPRAVLPGNAGAGALTVDFETGAAAPSFYPFEPRMPPQDAAPLPQESQPPR